MIGVEVVMVKLNDMDVAIDKYEQSTSRKGAYSGLVNAAETWHA